MYSQLQAEAVEASAADDAAPDAHAAGDAAPAVARRPSSLASLKAEIARAMQVAADRERERIDATVGEDETVQVEKIVGRAAAEAAELSKHADEDVNVVNAWYKDQVKRFRAEADRQIDDRRAALEQSLTHHGSLIEAEIESVHLAVQGYRGTLGAFFGRLAEEKDPSAIARLAGDLPDPPDLDEVRAEARSAAMQALEQGSAETPEPADRSASNGNGRVAPERDLVAVMDPGAVNEQAGTLDGTTVLASTVPPAPIVEVSVLADEPESIAEASAVAVAAPPVDAPEAPVASESVATRLLRALKYRSTPPAETPEDH